LFLERNCGTGRAVPGRGQPAARRQVNEFDPALAPYAEYALTGNGKHLRPTLVALVANSLGPVNESHVTVAVIIEMVHLATLVHDDIMDEAEIRRGQLTLAANWGNEIAVLFGDCLFAQALKLAASFPTPEICRAVAASTNTVCSGEILQTRHRRSFERSRREYFRVLEMKTAELFALSCEMAACLSGAGVGERLGWRSLGCRSARRIRFTTIAWMCLVRRRRRENRSAQIWPRAS